MHHSGGQLSLTQMDTDALRARRWTRIFGEVSSNLYLRSPCRFEIMPAKERASTDGETRSKDLASFATKDWTVSTPLLSGQLLSGNVMMNL